MLYYKDKPLLYSYFRSSCSYRVRIALALKEIDYDYKAIHLVKGEQHGEEYRKFNPLGQVPCLVTEQGKSISQSVAIMEYLEEAYPNTKRLLPRDPIKRAKVREMVEAINAGTQPPQNLSVMNMARDKPEERQEWGRYWIERGLRAVEQLVRQSAGRYCVGQEVSLADCCLVPQVYNAQRFKVDMNQFPNINALVKRLEDIEAFQAAAPTSQPDCPPELK